MSRRRVDADDVSVSLFPFLAVLICTVGALIVLLVVVVQQARVRAEEVATQKQDQQHAYRQLLTNLRVQEQEADRLAKRASDFVHQIDVQKQRAEQSRNQLVDLQRHLSDIEKEGSRLSALADQLDNELQTAVASRRQASARKQALQSRIQNVQQLLDAAQEAVKNRRATYALVPYDGPYGTNRRPIYIECRRDRIILQPEGIELSQRDFRQPLGPENALASALRATREYWRETNGNSHQAYPLLVVRPDGAQTYAVARAALKFWDAEFGYELVPEEMELSYPQPDVEVANRQRNAIAQAQLRRRIMRESLSGRAQESADDSPYLLRASNRGGFSRIPTSSGQDSESKSSVLRGRNSRRLGKRRTDSGQFQDRESAGEGRRANDPGRNSGYPYPSTLDSRVAGNTRSDDGKNTIKGSDAMPSWHPESDGSPTGRARLRGQERLPDDTEQPSGTSFNTQGRSETEARVSGNAVSSSSSRWSGISSDRSDNDGGAGHANDQNSRTLSDAQGNNGASSNQSSLSFSSSEGSESQSASMVNADPNSSFANWAIPGATGNSMGITRPISATCSMDRIAIHGDSGSRSRANVVPFNAGTASAVDKLVRVIQQRIGSWGMAGPSMYWKPVMQVEVTTNGESRYDELSRLLEGSGISLQRKPAKGRHATR